jgi:hypothetical protein
MTMPESPSESKSEQNKGEHPDPRKIEEKRRESESKTFAGPGKEVRK